MEGALVAQQNFDIVDPAAIAAAETVKAQIQAAYIMASRKPRNEAEARDRILAACRRPEFAARVEYKKPINKKDFLKGPSIRFAEQALRDWGNIRSDIQVLHEDADIRRVRVSVLDLENNTQFCKDIQIRKTVERKSKNGREQDVIGERLNTYKEKVYLLRATEEELYTKESAFISKALRNEGLRLIPADIVDEAMATAKETLVNEDSKDPKAASKRVFDSMSSIGVKPKELQKYFGGQDIETLSPPQLDELRGIYAAIKDGDATWRDYVNKASEDEEKKKAAADLTDKIKGKPKEPPALCPDTGKPRDPAECAGCLNDGCEFKATVAHE
jgi:hypothetical protein